MPGRNRTSPLDESTATRGGDTHGLLPILARRTMNRWEVRVPPRACVSATLRGDPPRATASYRVRVLLVGKLDSARHVRS